MARYMAKFRGVTPLTSKLSAIIRWI